ncbi:hypothetical protein [Streptococcus dysgalactiae]|uniref:hypothetical protein n=1 Tax=Streptococcus dysgalactiae TaxID=1334 RepID=UPI00398350FA
MKVDVTVTEVKENGKTFLRLIEATKELRELSALATAIYNGSPDICWFLIKQDGFNVYPRKDGEVYDELFYFINDNYKMLADYADKFLDGWNMEIGDMSHAEAIVWIMENMTDAWSKRVCIDGEQYIKTEILITITKSIVRKYQKMSIIFTPFMTGKPKTSG